VRTEGFVYVAEQPGTIELKVYYHPGTGDVLTTARAEGIQSAEASGYQYAGWIYPFVPQMVGPFVPQMVGPYGPIPFNLYMYSWIEIFHDLPAPAGSVPLKLYKHSSSNDSFTTASKAGQTSAVWRGYQFVRTEGYVLDAYPPDAEIIDFEPNLLLEGVSTRVRIFGKHLYPYRFLDTHHGSLRGSFGSLHSSTITKLDSEGKWVEIYLGKRALDPDSGCSINFKRYKSPVGWGGADYEYQTISPSIPIREHLGEMLSSGRSHTRVTEENDWKWSKRVGPSINFKKSVAGETVDAVIQTFTGKKMQCKTWLAEAHKPFTDDRVVITRAGFNSKELDLPDGVGTIRRHRAKFSGLNAGRYYHYKVGCWHDEDGGRNFLATSTSYFRAPPSPSDRRDVSIAIWSDSIKKAQPSDYFIEGRLDSGPHERWINAAKLQSLHVKAIENMMNKNLLDFSLVAGDVIDEDRTGGVAGGNYFGYLTRYHSMLELVQAGTPIFPIHGNHDVIDFRWWIFGPRKDDFFKMMATPLARSSFPYNQWYSFDWGNTHVIALDLIPEEGQKGMLDGAQDDGLSIFGPNTEQRNWFIQDLNAVDRDIKWRLIFHHGQPRKFDGESGGGLWDPKGDCGTWRAYRDYCKLMNDYNIDFLFTGHTRGWFGDGLRRHLSQGSSGKDIVFSIRSARGQDGVNTITHARLRDDAIVLSRIWPGSAGEFLSDEQGTPTIGGLFECYKYVPGVKPGCNASQCVEREYSLTRLISESCDSDNYDLGQAIDMGDLRVPCCKQIMPGDPTKCLGSNGQPVDRTVWIKVLECDRASIPNGCLRRQLIPIVVYRADNMPPHVTNEDLLRECTPCVKRADGYIMGLSDVSHGIEECGR